MKKFKILTDCNICTYKKLFIKNKCKICNNFVCKKCNKEISCCPFCKDENLGKKDNTLIQEELYNYHEGEYIQLGLEEAIRLHEEINGQSVEETNKEFSYEEQVELTQ